MESRCTMLAPGLMPESECCTLTSSASHIYPVMLSINSVHLWFIVAVFELFCVVMVTCAMPKTQQPGSHSAQDLFHSPVLK